MHKVIANIKRPDPSIVERFRDVWVEVVVERLGRSQMMNPLIKPICNKDWCICGPAVTVLLEDADVMMTIASTDVAQKGDVIVVAAQGHTHASPWGGGLALSAKNVGVEGVVVDGVVHDIPALLHRGVPVYALGSHLLHGTGDTPGSINVPVSCGGVVVAPGDLIIGDPGGIVVVPESKVEEILEASEEKTTRLREVAAELESTGRTLSQHRNQRQLVENAGVIWED